MTLSRTRMSGTCFHCGIPIQRVVKYVGIADVVIGLINVVVMAVYTHTYEVSATRLTEERRYLHNGETKSIVNVFWIPRAVFIFFLVMFAIQFVMGIVLYIGAVNKSRSICQFYLITVVLTFLFTCIPLRIYEMILVNEFSNQLRDEQEVTYLSDQQSYPQQAQPQFHQQPPTYGQQPGQLVPPIGPSIGSNNNTTTSGAYSTVYSNPNSVPPTMTQYGNASQYASQFTYSSPAPQPQPLPPALQPPPHYDTVVKNGSGGYGNTGYAGSAPGLFPNPPREEKPNGYSNTYSKF